MNSVKQTLAQFLVSALLLLSANLVAQVSTINGRVVLANSDIPLPGILVTAGEQATVTNTEGAFTLETTAFGSMKLVASSVGFVTVRQTVELQLGATTHVIFEMEEAVVNLPQAVVESMSLTGGLRGLRNVPGSAAYLSTKELERFSYTDVNRTLRAVPGINLQEEDGFGLRPNIGLRGAGSERSSKITLMEDGVLAAPAPYAAPAAYYFPTIGRMSAVEVLKGSSQVRFGPYTTGGAINLISSPIPSEFSGRLDLLGGSFGNRNIHASVGDSQRNFGYLVETFQYKSDGFKQLDGGGDTGFDKKDYLLKFQLNTGPKAKIYQSINFKIGQVTELSNETYLGLSQADFDEDPYRRYAASQKDQMKTQQEQYSVRHLMQFSKQLDLTTTAYRQDFHRNWYKLDKVKESGGAAPDIHALLKDPAGFPEAYSTLSGTTSLLENALLMKANNRTYRSQGIQSLLSWRFAIGGLRNTLDLGMRLHSDEADRFQWTDDYKMEDGVMLLTKAGQPGTESNRIDTGKALATHAQLKVQWRNLTLVPGVRHEQIRLQRDDYGKDDPDRNGSSLVVTKNQVGIIIPGIGVDYKLNSTLNMFAGVHKGFSPPSLKEGSRPEESINYELGGRLRKGRLSGTAVLFYNDYKNLLGADLAAGGGTGSNDLFNGGDAKTQGLEFQTTWEVAGQSEKGWSLPLSIVYTFMEATFNTSFSSEFEGWGEVSSGDELPYLAKHQLTVMASLSNEQFAFNLSGRYQGDMRTAAGQGSIPASEKVTGFFIVDASASYQLLPNVSLFVNGANLLDEVAVVSRHPSGLRPTMPRSFLAGLKVRF